MISVSCNFVRSVVLNENLILATIYKAIKAWSFSYYKVSRSDHSKDLDIHAQIPCTQHMFHAHAHCRVICPVEQWGLMNTLQAPHSFRILHPVFGSKNIDIDWKMDCVPN